MAANGPMLSKSRFLAGLQCRLRLWHQCYNPELAQETSPSQQAIFDMGHDDLLAYCSHDTLGMVKIREELLKRF